MYALVLFHSSIVVLILLDRAGIVFAVSFAIRRNTRSIYCADYLNNDNE